MLQLYPRSGQLSLKSTTPLRLPHGAVRSRKGNPGKFLILIIE